MKKLFFLFILISRLSSAQINNITCNNELKLLEYLAINKKSYESIILSKSLINSYGCDKLIDSINFFTGFAYYQLKNFDSAYIYFLKVNSPDTLYNKSRFFAALNLLYAGKIYEADTVLNTIKKTNGIINEMNVLYKAGICLHQRDENCFNYNKKNFSYKYYQIANEEKKIDDLYNLNSSKSYKSPVKAAIFSAIVPGSGKLYCKKKGQAVTSFLTVAILSVISSENIIKRGWLHPVSLSGIAITGIFYIGNIYGSYYLAKTINKEFDEKINQDILYYLHVALRNVYY